GHKKITALPYQVSAEQLCSDDSNLNLVHGASALQLQVVTKESSPKSPSRQYHPSVQCQAWTVEISVAKFNNLGGKPWPGTGGEAEPLFHKVMQIGSIQGP